MSDILEYAAWKEFIKSVDTLQNITDDGYKELVAYEAAAADFSVARSGVGGGLSRTDFIANTCCPTMVQAWTCYITPNVSTTLTNGFKVCDTSGYYRCGATCNWTVPANVYRAQIQMWGSGGNTSGMCCCGGSPFGPSGAYQVLDMQVVPGETICMCAGCAYCCYANMTQDSFYTCFSGIQQGSGSPGCGAFNVPQDTGDYSYSQASSPANISNAGNTWMKYCGVNSSGATTTGCTAAIAAGGKSSYTAWNYDWQQVCVYAQSTTCYTQFSGNTGNDCFNQSNIPAIQATCCSPSSCNGWNFCWDSNNDSVCVPHIFAQGIGFGKFTNYEGQCEAADCRTYYYHGGLNGIWPSVVIGYDTATDSGDRNFTGTTPSGEPNSFTISPPVFGFEDCTLCMPYIGCSGCYGAQNQCTSVGRWGCHGAPFRCSTQAQQFGPGFGATATYQCGGAAAGCGDSGRMGMICVSWDEGCWWNP